MKARLLLKDVDADELNRLLGTDRFIFQYVHAAKNRGDQDDSEFMGVLQESLKTFKTQIEKKQADAKDALAFSFDPGDTAPRRYSSKGNKGKGNNQVSYYLHLYKNTENI